MPESKTTSSQRQSNLIAVMNALVQDYDFAIRDNRRGKWQEACMAVIEYFGGEDVQLKT